MNSFDQNYKEDKKYIRAKNRVEQLGKYYRHLSIFLAVNIFLSTVFIIGDVKDGDEIMDAIFNLGNYNIALLWGIGLLIHTIKTFGFPLLFSSDWEERKIEEYLNEDKYRR